MTNQVMVGMTVSTKGGDVDTALSASSDLPATLAGQGLADTWDVLAGADSIRFFGDLGGQFCLVEGRSKKAINPRNEWGDALSWVDTPISTEAAILHLARGNVGLLTGRGSLALIDIDNDLAGFLARYPRMSTLPRITRDNAPERAKLLVVLADEDIRSRAYKGNGRKLELLALGSQGVIAGTHDSGATIKLRTGSIAVFHIADVERMAQAWTGADHQVTPTAARASKVLAAGGSFVRDVYRWANQQPGYQAEARSLLAACPHQGMYVATRPDDRTPSTLPDHDPYTQVYGPTWRDYGTGEKLDVCEMIARLRPIDKRDFLWNELVPAYKRATGK